MTHGHRPSSLTHYDQVSLYDQAFARRRHDVEFYLRRAAELAPDGEILEFGAGTGRVTLPLARAGYQVTAVDAAPAMLGALSKRLSAAKKRVRDGVSIHRGDMKKVRLGRRFPLVLATFNVVGHLETFQEMAAFLRTARAHLVPGGRLLFDVPIPHPDEIEADPDERHRAPRFKHPETGKWVQQTERFEYDAARQVLLVESEYRVQGMPDALVVPLTLRQWFPKELEAILTYEGFSDVSSYADYTDQPGLVAQDTLIMSAAEPP